MSPELKLFLPSQLAQGSLDSILYTAGRRMEKREKESLLQVLITITERCHLHKGRSHLPKKKQRGTLSVSNHKGNQTDNKPQRL